MGRRRVRRVVDLDPLIGLVGYWSGGRFFNLVGFHRPLLLPILFA